MPFSLWGIDFHYKFPGKASYTLNTMMEADRLISYRTFYELQTTEYGLVFCDIMKGIQCSSEVLGFQVLKYILFAPEMTLMLQQFLW